MYSKLTNIVQHPFGKKTGQYERDHEDINGKSDFSYLLFKMW